MNRPVIPLFVLSFMCIAENIHCQVREKADSLKKASETLDFRQLPVLKQAIKEEKAQGKTLDKSSEQVYIQKKIERNAVLNSIYVENSEFTHIAPSMMVVGGDWECVLDASINFNLFPIPKHLGVGVVINPKFNLRMLLDKESAPIRTPSNMIGITVFKHVTPGLEKDYHFVSGSVFHHSNGQDRGSYNPDGSINLNNGNFGVNYCEVSYMYGRMEHKGIKAFNYYGEFGIQLDKVIGDTRDKNPVTGEPALLEEYGQKRLNFEFSFSRYKMKDTVAIKKITKEKKKQQKLSSYDETAFKFYRVMLDGSAINAGNQLHWNAEIKAYLKFDYSPNFMITAQVGWLGHDYYNIYFGEQTWVFRLGIAAAFLAGPGSKPGEIERKYLQMMKK